MSETASQCGNRILAAFDFDRTIVERDSYLTVCELLPAEKRGQKLHDVILKRGWIAFICQVLEQLFSEHKMDARAVGRCVRAMAPVPGMLRVLRRLARHPSVDLCIVSDSNSFFIDEWLQEYALEHLMHEVYTNPGCVQASGEVIVLPFEEQTQCDLCPSNLCKGCVLRQLIDSGIYRQVLYVGDSCNDLCAMRQLRPKDFACIRRGFELHSKMAAHGKELSCKVVSWRDGHELDEVLLPQIGV
ncbi:hypothetical protein KR018_003674 [Drosophila ironensis]|nr:hypothetical protein KR018_003674 [Drosophila ironensis]